MSDVFESATVKLAQRTSRRSFLGRSGKALIGIVGGTALLTTAGRAHAAELGGCSCSSPCETVSTCDCYEQSPAGSQGKLAPREGKLAPPVTYRYFVQCPPCIGGCNYSYCSSVICQP